MHSKHSSRQPFRFGVEVTPDRPISEAVALAKASEHAGIEAVFVSNHFDNRDPALILAQIATQTDSISLGPGVLNPYEAHPARLATHAATLDELSDGRAVLGVGAGDRSTLHALGIEHDRPARRVDETISVCRRLWGGERVDHEGTFSMRDGQLNYSAGEIPIYVGAQGPVMLRMGAAVADGLLVNAAHPRDYQWAREHITAGRERRAPELEPARIAAFASVSVAEDAERARAAARPPVAFITAGAPGETVDRHELDPDRVAQVQAAMAEGEHGRAYELVSPAMLDAFSVTGTPEDVEKRLAALLAEADAVVFGSPLGPDPLDAIEILGGVVDRLQEAVTWSR